MKRLFLAVDLSEKARAALAGSMEWMAGFPGARVVPPKNYHVTLKFLGPVPEDRVPSIRSLLDHVSLSLAPCALRVQGSGVFPEIGHPSVFWAGIEPLDQLRTIFQKCESALEHLGFPPEKREFTAHVTLARADRDHRAPAEFLRHWRELDLAPGPVFDADHLTLYESVPTAEASVYESLAYFRLRG